MTVSSGRRASTVLVLAVAWTALTDVAPADLRAAGGAAPDCADATCAVEAGRAMLADDRAADAATYLADAVERFPGSGPLQVLLGASQLRAGEPLWAIDTLSWRLEEEPRDCEARIWLAWAWLEFAAVEEALALLEDEACAATDPWAARSALVRAFAHEASGDDEAARSALAEADRRETALPADLEVLEALERRLRPDRLPELSWRLDVLAGYSTNPLLGAPGDPRAGAALDTRSGVLGTEVFLRFAPDFDHPIRPLLELSPKLQYIVGDETADQSFLDLSGRVGLVLDWEIPRILLAYKPSYLMLFDDDRYGTGPTSAVDPYWVEPLWYYAAHRAEVEAEVLPWLLAFAGAGRREFYELGRTRTELDGGFGGNVGLGDRLTLLWTVTARGHWAVDPAYDVGGVAGGANLVVRLPAGWSSRVGLTVAGDWYPASAGAEAFGGESAARADLFLRAGFVLWTATFGGLRAGLSYDYSSRDSTLPDFDFEDLRLLLRLTWTGDGLLTPPAASREPATADIDWGLDDEDAALVERVQDLLRQDEQVYRSCGCAE